MNNRQPQLALREWRGHMSQPVTLAALCGAGAVLAVAGPFNTMEVLRFVPRLIYWLVIVFLCYSCGFLVAALTRALIARLQLPVRALINGTATAVGVISIVALVNFAALGYVPSALELPGFVGSTFLIAIIISGVSEYIGAQDDSGGQGASEQPAPPPIMDRLPFDKRGRLMSLGVEDHYVRIRTDRGEELVLMRLSDAIREVGSTNGAQVHRSHWVAWSAVASVQRAGDRAVLTLQDDSEVPVSRANLAKLKEAGLLPRG